MSETIGFIGLGAMGLPMTARLANGGWTLRVFDADARAQERAARLDGVMACPSTAVVAGSVDVLFTCLPNDAVVREAYLGSDGIAEQVRDGCVTVDCSTVSPGVSRDVAMVLAEQGVDHMDASMLGSVPQAETGEIGFVVGGAETGFARIAPLLDRLGRFRVHAGGPGAGNRIKVIHQSLVAINAAAVAEAVALCKASGTDLDCFYEVVCGGGGMAQSRYFEKRVPRMRAGDFTPLFMLDLMTKDAGLAQGLADEAGLETPLLDQAVALFREAQAAGWGAEDFSAIAHRYERAIGQSFADGETP
jgi:3-hydroxyisobutyrate dehydrogenase-like beta-hydroxyacid dehydrogenase